MERQKAVEISEPNFRELSVARVVRLYPFVSGCGTVANSRLIRSLTGQRDVNLWARVAGGMAVVPTNDLVGRSMYFVGDLDPKVSWAVDRFARPGDVTLDIGANLGLVTLRLARQVGPAGRVYAFEPNPVLQRYLDATKARNPDLPVTVHPVALGKEPATLLLAVPSDNAGAASLVDLGGRKEAYEVPVPVQRLDDFVEQEGIERIDFMKIDVEGYETQVLQGATRVLRELRPRTILLEENGFRTGAPLPPSLRLLQGAGYEIHGLPKRFLKVEMVPISSLPDLPVHDFVALRVE